MTLLKAKSPKAPLARPTLARRFNGGCGRPERISPVRDGRKLFAQFFSVSGLEFA